MRCSNCRRIRLHLSLPVSMQAVRVDRNGIGRYLTMWGCGLNHNRRREPVGDCVSGKETC
jgi:hypothetical protein